MRHIVILTSLLLCSCAPRLSVRPPRPISSERACDNRAWPQRVVNVYVSAETPPELFGPGDRHIQEILDQWNQTDLSLTLRYKGRQSVRPPIRGGCHDQLEEAIYIHWAERDWHGDQKLLANEYSCYRDTVIQQSVIVINAVNHRYAPLFRRAIAARDEHDLRLILVHELGHSLGLGQCEHDTIHPRSVMAPTFFPGEVYRGLDPADVLMVRKKYPH